MDKQPFRKFASAFWRNWLSLMSGGPSVPLAILGFYLESPVAKILLWVTAGGCLVLSAYSLWRPERAKVIELQNRLAQISEDRPLSFNGLSIGRYVQPHPPHGDWIIERIELGFENMGDQRISWTITEFFYENGDMRSPIPLPAGAGRYCLLARESLDYGFDVPGLQIQLQPLRVPTIIRFGFSVDYDNIPNLRVRHTRRILDCRVRGLWSGDYDWDVNIVEQVEC